MAILLLVGEGREEPEVVLELLDIDKYPGKPQYMIASELPLVLNGCGFDKLYFMYQPRALWSLLVHFQQKINDSLIAAARAKNSFEEILAMNVRRKDVQELLDSLQPSRIVSKDSNMIDGSATMDTDISNSSSVASMDQGKAVVFVCTCFIGLGQHLFNNEPYSGHYAGAFNSNINSIDHINHACYCNSADGPSASNSLFSRVDNRYCEDLMSMKRMLQMIESQGINLEDQIKYIPLLQVNYLLIAIVPVLSSLYSVGGLLYIIIIFFHAALILSHLVNACNYFNNNKLNFAATEAR